MKKNIKLYDKNIGGIAIIRCHEGELITTQTTSWFDVPDEDMVFINKYGNTTYCKHRKINEIWIAENTIYMLSDGSFDDNTIKDMFAEKETKYLKCKLEAYERGIKNQLEELEKLKIREII